MRRLLVPLVVLSLLAAACGPAAGARSGGRRAPHGPVDVLYAGSLVTFIQQQVAPAFDKESGDRLRGFAGGSEGLASEIKGEVRQADVFISASPSVDVSLEGSANGSWVSWYATFAKAPLVLGYDPRSRFASQLRREPWYKVVVERGFLLGRTDPAIDPKGKLAVEALRTAAAAEHEPALAGAASSSTGVFPEEALVGRLQAGQLDAGFFYANEARAAGIPTVPLAGVSLGAAFTVTVVERAPHPAEAAAFVSYLLGPRGRAVLRKDGFTLVDPPRVSGGGVPGSLRGVL